VIVVADDLGGGREKDTAIVSLLEAGLVDGASALPNGPTFALAAELVGPFAGRVGLHLVLTEGEPLTDPIRWLRRFCDEEGRYRPWRGAERALRLGGAERSAVMGEWRAQAERLRATGLAVSHVDSHHHVHTEPGLSTLVVALARELGVPRVRLARNWGSGLGPMNRAWKSLFNARLERAGLAGTRWFGGVADYQHDRHRRRDPDDFELMVHPILCGSGEIEDEETPGLPLAERLRELRGASAQAGS
jgi:chitin disaccharide deacetylase